MSTPNRGYTELPGAAVPDVPYRVNVALREIDADVQEAVAELEATDATAAGRLAALEAAAGFGSGMQLQDDAVNGLLLGDTKSGATLTKQIETKGPAATVAAMAVPTSPTRTALDALTLGHLADTFHGPLKTWGEALRNQRSKPAVWVNLGSSTAAGGTTRWPGQRWAERVAQWISGKSLLNDAVLPRLEPVTARPTTAGVFCYQGATGGTTSSNYITAEKLAAIKALQPDLITHMVGSNDYGNGTTLATYKANMRNWMDQLNAASPNTVHLMIHQQPRNDIAKPAAYWWRYGDALREVAEVYPNAAFLDASVYFPAEGMMPGHLMAESIHMNETGHRVLAQIVAAAMGNPMMNPGPELYVPEWVGANNDGNELTFVRHVVPAAPYPREVTIEGDIYAYGKLSTGNGTAAEIGVRLGYVDNHENPMPAGPNFQIRITHGGAPYANNYPVHRTFHVDANRPAYVFLIAGTNVYVSGSTLYTQLRISAVPA